jgi:hypothetical protein
MIVIRYSHNKKKDASSNCVPDQLSARVIGWFVLVIPELEMLVGITAGDYSERDKLYPWESELAPGYIIPAALAGEAY